MTGHQGRLACRAVGTGRLASSSGQTYNLVYVWRNELNSSYRGGRVVTGFLSSPLSARHPLPLDWNVCAVPVSIQFGFDRVRFWYLDPFCSAFPFALRRAPYCPSGT